METKGNFDKCLNQCNSVLNSYFIELKVDSGIDWNLFHIWHAKMKHLFIQKSAQGTLKIQSNLTKQ